jgi:hypothetical protein
MNRAAGVGTCVGDFDPLWYKASRTAAKPRNQDLCSCPFSHGIPFVMQVPVSGERVDFPPGPTTSTGSVSSLPNSTLSNWTTAGAAGCHTHLQFHQPHSQFGADVQIKSPAHNHCLSSPLRLLLHVTVNENIQFLTIWRQGVGRSPRPPVQPRSPRQIRRHSYLRQTGPQGRAHPTRPRPCTGHRRPPCFSHR